MTQPPFRGMCEWCGKEIWAHRCAIQRVGWTLERQAGGANAVLGPDRADTGKVMHEVCHMEALNAEKRGTHRNQMTIS
jgi:hypothetical protein